MFAESLSRDVFFPLTRHGSLHTERFLDEVSIRFIASALSDDERDSTYVKLRWCVTSRELWICQLHVTSCLRGQGIGKMLVATSEQLAYRLHARSIHVFPLQPARTFWLGVGYEPHARISRLLTKTPALKGAIGCQPRPGATPDLPSGCFCPPKPTALLTHGLLLNRESESFETRF